MIIFGFGSAVSSRLSLPKNSVLNSTLQMLFAGFFWIILSVFTGEVNSSVFANIQLISWLSLFYLVIFGGVAMLAYIYLIKYEPLSRVSTYAFVNPIGATIIGVLIGEHLRPNFYIAAPMILAAIIIILRARKAESKGNRVVGTIS
ncbi:MAG: EamA family transporter [Nanoarchaeota archaeon]|nr:EamA family transporter [Nanoarchaeota archaeon]